MKSMTFIIFTTFLILCFNFHPYNIKTAYAYTPPSNNDNGANILSKNGSVFLNFRNISVSTLVDFISKVTHKNFMYSGKLKGKITIISAKKISIEEAYRVFLTALSYKGYTVIKRNSVYKIVRSYSARHNAVPVNTKKISGNEFETRIIKLNYMNARSMANILKPLLSPAANIQSYALANSLIITDYASDIRKTDKIIKDLDVPNYGQKIGVIPIKYIKASKIAGILNVIYTGSVVANYSMANLNSQFVRIIPYNSTNSLIVMASKKNFKKIIDLITSLDVRSNSRTFKIYVYKLKYAKADTIAKILTNMMSYDKSLSKTGFTENNSHTRMATRPFRNHLPFIKKPMPESKTTSIGGGISLVGKAVIIPDENDNSLIIGATPFQYNAMIDVIKKLDIRRKQVFVQVIIAEVNLQKSQEVGVQSYGLKGNMFGGGNYNMSKGISDFLSNPFSVSGFIAGTAGGSMILPIGPNGAPEIIPSFAVLFRLIATNSAINVLSAPDLLTLDNQKASIMVGENVPFVTSSATSQYALQNIVTQVQRQNVGVKLEITPMINSNHYLSLKIYVKISAIIPSPDGLSANLVGPTTSNRYIKTTVLVKNNQTVIIGGLIQSLIDNTTTGIPILEDIPLLGYLFKDTSHRVQKDNLVILVSPKIISSPSELLNITNKHNKKFLKSLKKGNEPLPGVKQMVIISPKYVNHDK